MTDWYDPELKPSRLATARQRTKMTAIARRAGNPFGCDGGSCEFSLFLSNAQELDEKISLFVPEGRSAAYRLEKWISPKNLRQHLSQRCLRHVTERSADFARAREYDNKNAADEHEEPLE